MKSSGTAYLLWLLGLLGLCGLHRFYAGKTGTGLLWLLTFGLLGVGQLIDVFLIPGMIDDENRKLSAFHEARQNVIVNVHPGRENVVPPSAPVARLWR